MKRADADARSLVFERQLPHPPEKVWRALPSLCRTGTA